MPEIHHPQQQQERARKMNTNEGNAHGKNETPLHMKLYNVKQQMKCATRHRLSMSSGVVRRYGIRVREDETKNKSGPNDTPTHSSLVRVRGVVTKKYNANPAQGASSRGASFRVRSPNLDVFPVDQRLFFSEPISPLPSLLPLSVKPCRTSTFTKQERTMCGGGGAFSSSSSSSFPVAETSDPFPISRLLLARVGERGTAEVQEETKAIATPSPADLWPRSSRGIGIKKSGHSIPDATQEEEKKKRKNEVDEDGGVYFPFDPSCKSRSSPVTGAWNGGSCTFSRHRFVCDEKEPTFLPLPVDVPPSYPAVLLKGDGEEAKESKRGERIKSSFPSFSPFQLCFPAEPEASLGVHSDPKRYHDSFHSMHGCIFSTADGEEKKARTADVHRVCTRTGLSTKEEKKVEGGEGKTPKAVYKSEWCPTVSPTPISSSSLSLSTSNRDAEYRSHTPVRHIDAQDGESVVSSPLWLCTPMALSLLTPPPKEKPKRSERSEKSHRSCVPRIRYANSLAEKIF